MIDKELVTVLLPYVASGLTALGGGVATFLAKSKADRAKKDARAFRILEDTITELKNELTLKEKIILKQRKLIKRLKKELAKLRN